MKKSRAQQDAERLASLEADQKRVDTGEISVDEVEQGLDENDTPEARAQREAMYDEINLRVNGGEKPLAQVVDQESESDLRTQLANMKRTLSHYEQELNPAQRRAQQLEREVEELKAKLASVPPQPEGPTDYGLTDEEAEFETVTSIAKKVSNVENKKLNDAFKAAMAELDAKIAKFNTLTEESERSTMIAKHRADVSKALGGDNPDELFNHPKMVAWADEQTDEESVALRNPLQYSGKFIAGILTRFKAEVVKGQARREPSHGDQGVPSRVAPDTVVRSNGSASEPRFDARTFQKDVQKLISDGKTDEAQKLIAVAERAMSA